MSFDGVKLFGNSFRSYFLEDISDVSIVVRELLKDINELKQLSVLGVFVPRGAWQSIFCLKHVTRR